MIKVGRTGKDFTYLKTDRTGERIEDRRVDEDIEKRYLCNMYMPNNYYVRIEGEYC